MCRPQDSASKPTRKPRLAARSPSSRKSAAARSMPPSESGATLLHTMRRSQPSSAIRSNLRSARENALARCGSGMPSKSRNGWKVTASSPSSLMRRPTAAGVPSNDSRSFSKISTPLKRAAAIASSFSLSVPLRQTVAIAVCTCASHMLWKWRIMRSVSGLSPVNRRKASAAWNTAMPPPSIVRQPSARALRSSSVSSGK